MAGSLNGFAAMLGFIATMIIGYGLVYEGIPTFFWAGFAVLFVVTIWNFYIWACGNKTYQ